MQALTIKLFRDLWRQRLLCASIAMIVACGVASQVTAFSLIKSLQHSLNSYYEQYRFADVFVRTRPMPLAQADVVRQLSGVNGIQPRIIIDATIDFETSHADPATATLCAVPDAYHNEVNRPVIRQAKYLQKQGDYNPLHPLQREQILISEVFAQSRGLEVGDSLKLKIQGDYRTFTIAGVVISPEYVFQIRSGAGIPDNYRYAVIWMHWNDLESLTGMSGQFNNLAMCLRSDCNFDRFKEQLKVCLGDERVFEIQDRAQQISHQYTTNAIDQLYSVAIVPPVIFLSVAAFLTYLIVSRIVRMERENIAMQRALGYRPVEIAIHYFSFVFIVIVIGCVIGCGMGVWLAHPASGMYREIYRFHELNVEPAFDSFVIAAILSVVSGIAGSAASILHAVSIPPAVGLRPEPPASYRLPWVDWIVQRLHLSATLRMILRGLARWKSRSILGVLGMGLGIAVMILGSYTQDAVEYVIDYEFFRTRRYDFLVQFNQNTGIRALAEIKSLRGVECCEPLQASKCLVSSGNQSRSITLLGLEKQSELLRPLDRSLSPIDHDGTGIVLSEKLAECLNVGVGSDVDVVLQDNEARRATFVVRSIIRDYSGLNAYMHLADYQNAFNRVGVWNAALMSTVPAERPKVLDALTKASHVQAVTIKAAALENFRQSASKNLLMFRFFNILFSTVIGVGAVSSMASMSLAERRRDLALMRVLGYTPKETASVMLGELGVLLLCAIPVGCICGYGFASLATWMLNTETQRIPMLISPQTYFVASLTSVVAFALTAGFIFRSIVKLDFVTALKTRD